MQRRQSEIQADMDVFNAERNLSVAEAELKVFEDEIEHSTKFDVFSNLEEQDYRERTESYIRAQQQPLVLQNDHPHLLANTDQQTFLPVNVQSFSDRDVQHSKTKYSDVFNNGTSFLQTTRHITDVSTI